MTTDLPQGWQRVPLSRLVSKIEAGKSFKCEERPPAEHEHGIVKVSAVTWGSYDEQQSKTITDADRVNESYLIRPGDFLFSRANTLQLVGACVLVHSARKRLLLSDKILRFIMPDELKPWVLWFLRSAEGRRQIEALSTGNQESMRNIGQERIGQIEVPLPAPAAVQRIVSRIEELFSEIDEGERALERVRKLVERYRQSVLKAAVTGELTREWRAANSAFEWSRQQIIDIGEVTTGSTPPTADPNNYGPGLPFLKPTDLDQGYTVTTGRQSLTRQGLQHCRPLKASTVLVTCIGATIGKLGLARMPCATNQQINAVEVDSSRMRAKFLYWYLASPAGQRAIIGGASATTLPILNKSRFQCIEVPVPSLAEQDVLISLIEQHMEQADRAMSTVEHESRRLHALRQAVLKAAFSGQLVPQDPADEPASALLARLAAAQAIDTSATPRRRTRRAVSHPNPEAVE